MQKKLKSICFGAAVFICLQTMAQPAFRTVVPQQPVVIGEPFRVQYIMEDAEQFSDFVVPAFKGFSLVAGPDSYSGSTSKNNKVKQLSNISFTLSALHPGKFIVPGASVLLKGKKMFSPDVFVNVISVQQAERLAIKNKKYIAGSEYYLLPGEDPYEKIRKNLFLKVNVENKNLYVGEPVVATFKLYSRLESKSEVIKNPGFYGFGVHDMVNLNDKISSTEFVNGLPFDVHIIRKVQLYPLQAGDFIIDPMELQNKVEFSNSVVNKKTEQEIVENMYGKIDKPNDHINVTVYETSLKTTPVNIHVNPLPEHQNKKFIGAVGDFKISDVVEKKTIHQNEEGFLSITISGKGNFTQLGAPQVSWPAGIDFFEPGVTEMLDKNKVPLKGSKTFRYPFATAKPGTYLLKPIAFSFFNPFKKSFETVHTDSLRIVIIEKKRVAIKNIFPASIQKNNKLQVIMILAGSILFIALLLLLIKKRNLRKTIPAQEVIIENPKPSAEAFLLPVQARLLAEDKFFYSTLHDAIWMYFSNRLDISGSQLNKQTLKHLLGEKGLHQLLINDVIDLLTQCETGVYTGALAEAGKNYLLANAENILQKTDLLLVG